MANLYRAANEIDATLNKIMLIGEVIELQLMAIANGEYPPTPQEVIDDGEPEDFVLKNFDYNELLNRAIATALSMENTYAEGGLIGISDQPEYWLMDNLFPTGGWINNAVNNLAALRNRIETSYSPEDIALQRSNAATQPYSNYMKAEDLVPNLDLAVKQILDYGVSNCTLTASGFFNPDGRFARARTIASNPLKTGFYQVDKEHAIPGTMIIASLPGKDDSPKGGNIYHTMIISGYAPNDYTYNFKGKKYQVKKGDVLVNYSRGGRSADNYVKNVPLKVYTANSDGKTVNRFYRPLDNNGNPAVLLPNVLVTGTRKTK